MMQPSLRANLGVSHVEPGIDVTAASSPIGYWSSGVIGALTCIVLCAMGRARPGPWRITAARLIGLVLAGAIPLMDGPPDP